MSASDLRIAELNERAHEWSQQIIVGVVDLVTLCDRVLGAEAEIAALHAACGKELPPSLRTVAVQEMRNHLALITPDFGDHSAEEVEAAAQILLQRAIARARDGMRPTFTEPQDEGAS